MRFIGRLILSAVFLALAVLLAAAAMYLPGPFTVFLTDFSRDAAAFLSGIFASFPFPVWQVLLAIIVLLELYGLIRCFSNGKFLGWLSGLVLLISVLVFLFVGLWGINHFGTPVAQRVGLTVTEYSKDQLRSTVQYMAEQASTWADRVERDTNGDLAIEFKELAEDADDGYDVMAQTNAFFHLPETTVKPLLIPKAFSYMGLTGIYIAYTGESCVNPDTYAASIPFTMCHELAHSLSVAPENEANFCAFLACLNNDDPAFQYSGWYSAYIYTYNALAKIDPAAASEIRATLSETVLRDLRNASAHYDQYEGHVQNATEKLNDAYLKAFKEESGVQSYGEVADLLIAWYLQK